MARVLTVDDEAGIRGFVADVLVEAGHDVAQAEDAPGALRQLDDGPFDLLLLDLRMPGTLTGMDVLRQVRARWPDMQVIVLTAHGNVPLAVEAMRLGAFDFLQKPLESPAELRRIVTRALNWRGTTSPVRGVPAHEAFAGGAGHMARSPRAPAGSAARAARTPGNSAGPVAVVRQVLWQLKRRHVYNVAATYAAIAFIILQAVQLVLPALPLPSWTYTLLVGLTVAGFPVALVLGWIYDITSTGVRRTPSLPGEVKA